MTNKIRSLAEAAELVEDGATIAIGGLSMNSAPMSFVRELVRRQVKDLTVVAIVAGMPVDWLVAGGCVRRVVSGLISFEGFGLAPWFRSAVQRQEIALDEYSEHLLICRLQAAALRLPFVPTRAGLGTDILALHPETTRLEDDAASGALYVACTPLPVDVAIVHAHEADTEGNVRVNPKLMWMDTEIVRAATTTVVTVERIVDHNTFVADPARTTYPRFLVDAVVESRWGAYPTSLYPEYGYDGPFFESYTSAASDADQWHDFWRQRIVSPVDQAAMIDANGGINTLLRTRRASS